MTADTIAGIGTIALGLIGVVGLVVSYRALRVCEQMSDRAARAQNEANRWRDIANGQVRPARPVPVPTVTGEVLTEPIRGHRR